MYSMKSYQKIEIKRAVVIKSTLNGKPHFSASMRGHRFPTNEEIAEWVEEALIGVDPKAVEITINFENE